MNIKILLLLLLISIKSLSNPLSVLPEFTQSFQNIRDFTLHENEAYFSAQSTLGDLSVIIRIERKDNKWHNPQIASFSGQHHDIEPFIATNGLKLYFASKRPKSNESEPKNETNDYDIWYVERNNKNAIWSNPINMGNIVNSERNEFYPSIADNGNLYFTANNEDSKGKDDIYLSTLKDGKYQAPYSLSESINSDGDEYNAFIAADESYLIFGAYNRKDGFGSGDLYISYKKSDNNWTVAENMGEVVNSKQMDYCPFVYMNTLYFTSRRSNYKNTRFNDIDELLKTFNSIENGMSRIYQTDLELNHTTFD